MIDFFLIACYSNKGRFIKRLYLSSQKHSLNYGGVEYVESMHCMRKRTDVGQQRQPLEEKNEKDVQGKRSEGKLCIKRKDLNRLRLRKMP